MELIPVVELLPVYTPSSNALVPFPYTLAKQNGPVLMSFFAYEKCWVWGRFVMFVGHSSFMNCLCVSCIHFLARWLSFTYGSVCEFIYWKHQPLGSHIWQEQWKCLVPGGIAENLDIKWLTVDSPSASSLQECELKFLFSWVRWGYVAGRQARWGAVVREGEFGE